MDILFIIVLFAAIIIFAVLYFFERNKHIEILEINEATKIENLRLEDYLRSLRINIKNAEEEKESIEDKCKQKTEELSKAISSLDTVSSKQEQIARERAESEYKKKQEELEIEYQNKITDWKIALNQYVDKCENVKKQISDMEAKQLAYIQAKQREEEIASQKDYYRLVLSDSDLRDIQILRQMQNQMSRKDSIDKVIWDVYYKPAYEVLVSHLFKKGAKVCGIYKITSLIDEKSYIGQSVDIKERFRTHLKSAIDISATPKLYQELRKQGIENFTFEILEELPRTQLNEREKYWIEFFKTKDYGMNTLRGNK